MPVTRIEILDYVGDVLHGDGLGRTALVGHAADEGGRGELLDVLETLPDGVYRDPDDLWSALPEVPVDLQDALSGAGPRRVR